MTVSDPALTARRAFPAWSITIPTAFDETFVEEDAYWHAYDDERSVSLTSMVLVDQDGSDVTAEEIIARLLPVEGAAVEELPAGLDGWAVTRDAPADARASRMLQGLLAVDGRALIVTITSVDLAWAQRTWLTIRHHPDLQPGELGAQERTRVH
jgi:hypothetical protein